MYSKTALKHVAPAIVIPAVIALACCGTPDPSTADIQASCQTALEKDLGKNKVQIIGKLGQGFSDPVKHGDTWHLLDSVEYVGKNDIDGTVTRNRIDFDCFYKKDGSHIEVNDLRYAPIQSPQYLDDDGFQEMFKAQAGK